jgi:Aspartyl/Asparaginyl beta-hydroxylase
VNNFLFRANLPIAAAAKELAVSSLWNWLNVRKLFPGSSHKGIHDIIFRFAPMTGPQTFASVMDGLDNVTYFPAWQHLATNDLLGKAVLAARDGDVKLGRVIATRLDPGAVIDEHIDEGLYAHSHDRWHVVIDEGSFGSVEFWCGGEVLLPRSGMLFRFDHQQRHRVLNHGKLPRTHLIFDIRR